MNYLPATDPKILEDLTKRKEFAQYGIPAYDPEEPRSTLTDGWVQKYNIADVKEDDVALELSSYQSLVSNFINPNTPYSRLLLQWSPGSGKTLASINIAMQFIKLYEKESQMEDQQIGSVFVIGFTEEIFKRDLLSFPKFGFISREELKQLQGLREAAHHENRTDMDRLQEFMTRLKKRLGSRKENGYFRFFGYKAFVNRIFMLQDFKRNINDMSEDEIRQSLKDGSLQWNRPLLESFRNSLMICDEIHNVYNSLEKNNWGVALQMVLDQDPTIKAVYMSATPLNNNPTEVVDLANLMQPAAHPKLNKEDFFEGKELKPGALERIADVFRGRVSFIQDTDPRHFAPQEIVGDEIPGIPYLRFQRCPMSDFHYKTYKKVYTGVLAQDAQYLMDIAFPNPQDADVGLYRTTEINRALSFADEAWVKKYGFKLVNDIIVGPGLEEARIGEWSTKMSTLLKDIKQDLTPHGGKILVYHDVVHVSGVLFIEQLLAHNGFIGIDQNATESTLCAVCGKMQKVHNSKSGGGKWVVEAGSESNAAVTREFYKRVTGDDLPGPVVPCTTRVMTVDGVPIAVFQWYSEDAQITRIDALAVDPDHLEEGCEEYLLEQYAPDTVLTIVVPESGDLSWWREHYFFEHDRADGNVYMSFTGMPKLSDESAAILVNAADTLPDECKFRDTDFTVDRVHSERDARRYKVQHGDVVVTARARSTGQMVGYMVLEKGNIAELRLQKGSQAGEIIKSMIHLTSENVFMGTDGKFSRWSPERGDLPLTNRTGGAKKMEPMAHEFTPARYIVAHSDMDKSVMFKHIDRFNNPDNTWGYQCRVIIGSKIIKESYNFKAIRRVKVTARPANIATLIQILGRSRRKKAHSLLPPEFRTIECKIFTSCLPTKEKIGGRLIYQLSHEETKYSEKMVDYQIIQKIEQRIHEGAIDAITARSILLPGMDRNHPNLGALWFEPEIKARRYNIKDLNLSTFSIFHSQSEIHMLIYIIKRLFVETSLCFTYTQLWTIVRNPPFHVEQDCSIFQEDYFVIALSMLVYGTDTDATVRPLARTPITSQRTYLLDILHENIDKRIMQSDRTVGYINHINNLYVFVPFRNARPDIFTESPFRTFDLKPNRPINVMRYLKETSMTLNYENQKLQFKSKYENVALERLATVVGKYGVSFHQTFVEEIIKYVFTLWTSPKFTVKSEMHEFYFKMLYYYDLAGFIVWAATAREFIREMYKAWMLPIQAQTVQPEVSLSLSKPENIHISKSEFTAALKASVDILAKRGKKKEIVPIVRADPKVLAIGHFMGTVPRFYHPDKDWFESPEYVQRTQEYKENEVLVGYYEKSGTGLRVKFKIRTPLHLIEKQRDVRKIEKGSICSSNSKEYLVEMAKKLKIKTHDKINVPSLCQEIEERLQLNELLERKKKSNVKWFYAAWESHEGKRVEHSLSSSIRGGDSEYVVDDPSNFGQTL